jgi:hypothetical protein
MRLLDPRFKYVPSGRTDILATWRRFGFRPTTEAERRARQRASESVTEDGSSISAVSAEVNLLQRHPRSDRRRKSNLTLVAE